MFISHRINHLSNTRYEAVEVDFRSSFSKLLINHDRLNEDSEYISAEEYLKHINCDVIIANVKESGLEESIIELCCLYNKEVYFLDSQIPDIIRLSRKYPGKFIIRVSDFETLNYALLEYSKAKYVWLDWSRFDDFKENEYLNHINKHIKLLKSICVEPIIVSPELYNLEYSKYIPKELEGEFSVCTKLIDHWRKYEN